MAAAVIAVRNARNRRAAGPSRDVSESRRKQAEQQREFWAQLEKERKIASIMKKYDKEVRFKLHAGIPQKAGKKKMRTKPVVVVIIVAAGSAGAASAAITPTTAIHTRISTGAG
jgi:hypothetical protein